MNDPVALLETLSDPTRWKIVQFLARPVRSRCSREDGVCACDLESHLDRTQPTVSHHMKQLVDAGIVTSQRRGRWVYYELRPATVRALAAALLDLARDGEASAAVASGAWEDEATTGRAEIASAAPSDRVPA